MRNKIIFVLFFLFVSPLFSGVIPDFKPECGPRIISPGDKYNTTFYFVCPYFDDHRPSGAIYSITGMKISNFKQKNDSFPEFLAEKIEEKYGKNENGEYYVGWYDNKYLYWDAGSAPSGIYIWQIESGNEIYTGTVVVAR